MIMTRQPHTCTQRVYGNRAYREHSREPLIHLSTDIALKGEVNRALLKRTTIRTSNRRHAPLRRQPPLLDQHIQQQRIERDLGLMRQLHRRGGLGIQHVNDPTSGSSRILSPHSDTRSLGKSDAG